MNGEQPTRNNVEIARVIDNLMHDQMVHMHNTGIINENPRHALYYNRYARARLILYIPDDPEDFIIHDNGPRFLPPHPIPPRLPTYDDIYNGRHARRYIQNGCRIHKGPYGPLYINRMAGRFELRPRLPHHRPTRYAEHISTCLAKHYTPTRTHGRQTTPKLDTRHGSRLRLPIAGH
jgi:hypothetical protein